MLSHSVVENVQMNRGSKESRTIFFFLFSFSNLFTVYGDEVHRLGKKCCLEFQALESAGIPMYSLIPADSLVF